MKRMLAVSLALWLAMYGAGGVAALAESTPTDLETPPITEAPSESPTPEDTALPTATEPTETPSSTPVVLQDLTAAGGQVAW